MQDKVDHDRENASCLDHSMPGIYRSNFSKKLLMEIQSRQKVSDDIESLDLQCSPPEC